MGHNRARNQVQWSLGPRRVAAIGLSPSVCVGKFAGPPGRPPRETSRIVSKRITKYLVSSESAEKNAAIMWPIRLLSVRRNPMVRLEDTDYALLIATTEYME